LIGGLSFANYALFMFRNGITFTVDAADPILYARATTIAYLTIAFCQFANILSRRNDRVSLFSRNFFTNKILLLSIAGSICLMLLAIYLPVVRDFLQFNPPGFVDWVYVVGAGGVFLVVFEIMKVFKRMRKKY
jgi:Ca2+-transporting ATPase